MGKAFVAGSLSWVLVFSWTLVRAEEIRWQPIQPADPSAQSPAAPAPQTYAGGSKGTPAARLGKPIAASNSTYTGSWTGVPEESTVEPGTGIVAGGRPLNVSGGRSHTTAHRLPITDNRSPAAASRLPATIFRGQETEEIHVHPRPVESMVLAGPHFEYCDPCCLDWGVHGPWSNCWYGRAEYLLWWLKDAKTPALVTTSPQESFGILDEPGTRILYGGDIDSGTRHGGRFTFGKWFDPCEYCGIEGTFFFIANRATDFTASSPGSPLLARPFFNVNEGFEDSQLIANEAPPGIIPLSGSINVRTENYLLGFEANLRKNLSHGCTPKFGCNYHLDLLAGFRYLRFEEKLAIYENLLVPLQTEQFGGFGFAVTDRFTAENNFYGSQIGVDFELRKGRWFLNFRPKLAVGVVHQSASVAGATTFTGPGVPSSTSVGGLYALTSNIGEYDRTRFSIVPEIGVTLGWQLTDHLRLFVGYNLLYWFNVARPGELIDRGINPTLLPRFAGEPTGPNRPAFQFRDSSFWAQGLSFGFELRY